MSNITPEPKEQKTATDDWGTILLGLAASWEMYNNNINTAILLAMLFYVVKNYNKGAK